MARSDEFNGDDISHYAVDNNRVIVDFDGSSEEKTSKWVDRKGHWE